MKITVILSVSDGRADTGPDELLRLESNETPDPAAQRRVMQYITDRVLGLQYSLKGDGTIEFTADARNLTDDHVECVRLLAGEIFAELPLV